MSPTDSDAPNRGARTLPILRRIGVAALVLLGALATWQILFGGPDVPERTLLELDLERAYPEGRPADPVTRELMGPGLTLLDVVAALERAADDDRVVGLVARVGNSGMGLARIQEIRDAVEAFRESGKPAVAWAETFGEFGPGNGAYYLATAFDEIYLQPSGDVGLTGLLSRSFFLADGLDRIGIRIRGDRRHEYKNAFDVLTDTAFTEPHRAATEAVMSSQFGQMVAGIAAGRRLDSARVVSLADRGPFFGEEAREAGLVDGLAYRDQVYDRLEERLDGPTPLYLDVYVERAGGPDGDGAVVAVVTGTGTVARGESEYDPLTGSSTMGSETVTAAFRAALRDEEVQAVLFRVDSPGGSYVASDAIWRATVTARDADVPVVVSMGDVAGSGGYFVAMAADRIVAQPGTVTGSIGVLNFKALTDGFWEKLGIDWDAVQTSRNAEMWAGTEDFDPAEWDRLQAWLDRVYADFTTKMADGRGIPEDSIPAVARGRIWSGAQARDLGLVDDLGGYPVALRHVREVANLPEDRPLTLRPYPRPTGWWERIFGDEPASSRDEALGVALRRLADVTRPLVRFARRAGWTDRPETLRMERVPPAP